MPRVTAAHGGGRDTVPAAPERVPSGATYYDGVRRNARTTTRQGGEDNVAAGRLGELLRIAAY